MTRCWLARSRYYELLGGFLERQLTHQLDNQEDAALIDANHDGRVDEVKFTASLAAHCAEPTYVGAELVCVSGAVLQRGGEARPYTGINGVYQRSEDVVNGRLMFTKLSTATTALWWDNVLDKASWVVGPKAGAGTSTKIWAYVESLGKSPEQAAGRYWMVYSYDDKTYVRQEAITIRNVDTVVLRLQCALRCSIARNVSAAARARGAERARQEEDGRQKKEEEAVEDRTEREAQEKQKLEGEEAARARAEAQEAKPADKVVPAEEAMMVHEAEAVQLAADEFVDSVLRESLHGIETVDDTGSKEGSEDADNRRGERGEEAKPADEAVAVQLAADEFVDSVLRESLHGIETVDDAGSKEGSEDADKRRGERGEEERLAQEAKPADKVSPAEQAMMVHEAETVHADDEFVDSGSKEDKASARAPEDADSGRCEVSEEYRDSSSFESAGLGAVEWLAACDLQCVWRCYRARQRLFFALHVFAGTQATRIQTCFRRHQAACLLMRRKALATGTPLFIVFAPQSVRSPDLFQTVRFKPQDKQQARVQSIRNGNMQARDSRGEVRRTKARITLEDANTFLSNALTESQIRISLSHLPLPREANGYLRTQTSTSIFSTSFSPPPPSRLLPPLELPRMHTRTAGKLAHSNLCLEDVVDYVGELWEDRSTEDKHVADRNQRTECHLPSLLLAVLPIQPQHMCLDSANWHPEIRALGEWVLVRREQEVISVCVCSVCARLRAYLHNCSCNTVLTSGQSLPHRMH